MAPPGLPSNPTQRYPGKNGRFEKELGVKSLNNKSKPPKKGPELGVKIRGPPFGFPSDLAQKSTLKHTHPFSG